MNEDLDIVECSHRIAEILTDFNMGYVDLDVTKRRLTAIRCQFMSDIYEAAKERLGL